MLLSAQVLHTGDAVHTPGWVEVQDGRVAALGPGEPPGRPDRRAPVVAPGFVDVHCHGGGGASFEQATDAAVATALAAHRARGTTSTVASLVTAALPDLVRQVAFLAGWVERGELAGIHVEGPWLASGRRGAHEESLLAPPRPSDVAAVLDAGRGTIRQVTLAPELPDADAAIALLTSRGVTVSVGHTEASYAATRDAVARGVRGATHLFNAMPPLAHRDPGPVLALLDDERVTCELICDGIHVDADLCSWLLRTQPGRIALITDAMAAAGRPDGSYRLGGLDVTVTDGVARRSDDGAIAGSTLFLADAVARAAAHGVPLPDAVAAATAVPARFLGLDAGTLWPGAAADLVLLDQELALLATLRRGRWVTDSNKEGTT